MNTASTAPTFPNTSATGQQRPIPATLERYEAKYTIPLSMVEPISRFIAPYCSLDKHSELSPDLFYTINSLYFDTPAFLFLRQRLLKVEKRFNMRIRAYGETPSPPYFLEIKQRRGDVIRKSRALVHDDDLEAVIYHNQTPVRDTETPRQKAARLLFCSTAHQHNAHPVVLVQYRRKAYISDCDEYARVTFDTNLRYMPQTGYDPTPVEADLQGCDMETCFDPGCSVILELKSYTSTVPLWMIDLVRAFQLDRRGFSKYATCVKPMLDRYRTQGLFTRDSIVARSH